MTRIVVQRGEKDYIEIGAAMGFIERLEPRNNLEKERKIFSSSNLIAILIPSLAEQFFTTLVGLVDTLMVSYAGEAAVGGVSLVNQLAFLFIFVLSALSGGGGIVVSQYLGRNDKENADKAAGQFFLVSFFFGLLIMAICLLFRINILSSLFGSIERDVMDAATIYLFVTALSWPFQGIYSASASVFNAMGRTKVIMKVSVLMNTINVVGNFIGIFILRLGVLGVAIPTLIGRMVAAFVMVKALRDKENTVQLSFKGMFPLSFSLIALIVSISIPGALENFLFHFSKVAISSMVSQFGTSSIAAYGSAGNFWAMSSICAVALGRCFVTVIGRTMGAGDKEAAKYYTRYLLRISFVFSILWNLALLLISPLFLYGFALSQETKALTFMLILVHNLAFALLCSVHSALPNGLRASGDVKWVMGASIFSTVICRVFFSWLFGIKLGLGVIGVTLAMVADWSVKSLLVLVRYRSGKWLQKKVIS